MYYMIHHLAIRIDKIEENTLKKFSQLIVDEKIPKYIISFEIAKISKKLHYHAYVCIETHKSYKNYTNQLRKHIVSKLKCMKHQYYLKKCKDIDGHMTYMLKDLKVEGSSGFEEAELQAYLKETKRINDEKKKKMKQQLVDEIFKKKDLTDYREIMKTIIRYHVDREYLPPSPTLLLQYTIFVMVKLKLDTTELYMAKLNI